MSDGERLPTGPQTHCPGCGLHREAVVNVVEGAGGSWFCVNCNRKPAGTSQETMIVVDCPVCPRPKPVPQCATCGGLGSVRVPLSSLKVYDPRKQKPQQVLTEDGPAGGLTEENAG